MMFVIVITALLSLLGSCSGGLSASQAVEQNLITTLISDYNRIVRPEANLTAEYIIFLRQIVSMDEKNQIMTSSSYIYVLIGLN
jgi:hypothetical protein